MASTGAHYWAIYFYDLGETDQQCLTDKALPIIDEISLAVPRVSLQNVAPDTPDI